MASDDPETRCLAAIARSCYCRAVGSLDEFSTVQPSSGFGIGVSRLFRQLEVIRPRHVYRSIAIHPCLFSLQVLTCLLLFVSLRFFVITLTHLRTVHADTATDTDSHTCTSTYACALTHMYTYKTTCLAWIVRVLEPRPRLRVPPWR